MLIALSVSFVALSFLELPSPYGVIAKVGACVFILVAFLGLAIGKAIDYEVGPDYVAMRSGKEERRWTLEEIDMACSSPANGKESAVIVLFDKTHNFILFAHDKLIDFDGFREQIRSLLGAKFLVEDTKAIWERQKRRGGQI